MTIAKILKSTSSLLIALSLGLGAGVATAHSDGKVTPGYLQDTNRHVVKNNFGQCWRTGSWTPAMAIAECDPDLVKKEVVAKKPDTVPAQPLMPPNLGPDKPAFTKINLQAETLFDFDKAVLRADGKKTLDDEVVAKMKQYPEVEVVLVTGHADRIGSEKYNNSLSDRRAAAAKGYIVSQGIDAKRVETVGKGEAEPLVDCKDVKGRESGKNKKLVECLQPNRRVLVEVKVQAPAK
ncbi:MAG: OmpA family protein [Burkholderiales bacterium]|nr:OmpA family protein [Burkholderiales bacterium]